MIPLHLFKAAFPSLSHLPTPSFCRSQIRCRALKQFKKGRLLVCFSDLYHVLPNITFKVTLNQNCLKMLSRNVCFLPPSEFFFYWVPLNSRSRSGSILCNCKCVGTNWQLILIQDTRKHLEVDGSGLWSSSITLAPSVLCSVFAWSHSHPLSFLFF